MAHSAITKLGARGLTIGELSRRTGVNIETVRYYERIGLIPTPPRTAGGRRVYDVADVRCLGFVKRARELGFPIEEIRSLLALGDLDRAACADVCAVAKPQLAAIRAKIADLKRLETELGAAIERCGSGDGESACGVIEALHPE